MTENPTQYEFSYATSVAGATGSVSESCSLSGSSYAVCAETIGLSAGQYSMGSMIALERPLTLTSIAV